MKPTVEIKDSPLYNLLIKVLGGTPVPPVLIESLLKFVYDYDGYIAGSTALAMYLENIGKRSFNPEDIDIYIPVKDTRIEANIIKGDTYRTSDKIVGISAKITGTGDRNIVNSLTAYGQEDENKDWIYKR